MTSTTAVRALPDSHSHEQAEEITAEEQKHSGK
jgi:hypothetical protein